jgi:hypothetical protein
LVGQTVTVTVNLKDYTTTVQADGGWSVQLSNADALALNHGNTYNVYVSATNLAGNTVTDNNNTMVDWLKNSTPTTPVP